MAEQLLPARALAAVLFTGASMNVVDVFSATNSSPWTSESFGGDPESADRVRYYIRHGLAVSAFFSVSAALIAGSLWPVLGWLIAAAYMSWLYRKALERACQSGSTGW